MADRVGQQLGNYRLVHLLGQGGFADVYLGEHLYLKSYAALKVLRTSLTDEKVGRFLSEAQTLVRLTHPYIVRVLEFTIEQGTPILVMTYARGGTIRKRHPPGSCLSLEMTVSHVNHVAAALQYAHDHNVIHRDVKPENMLFDSDQQQLLLSDFGLSLLAPSPDLLSTQEMAGTLPYTAPEQLRGKPTFASDQYALGIVAYEWICGVRPFEGSYWQLVTQHVSSPPPRLREKDPSLPQAVEEVVLKALSKDPQQRYASVLLFARALELAAQVRVPVFRPDSPATEIPAVSLPTPLTTPRRVFLSAAHADDAFAARLSADLQRRKVTIWNQNPPGHSPNPSEQEEESVRQSIRAVDVVLVIISPNTRTSRAVKEHLRIADLYQRQLVFVWIAGDDIAEVLPDRSGKTIVIDLIDARETRYEPALDEIVSNLNRDPFEMIPVEPVLSAPAGGPRNPYKGLRAFTSDDAPDFFGRDTLIKSLTQGVRELVTPRQPGSPGARLVTVIGPSGSGKSSVVMAGLLPRLQQGALTKSGDWIYLEPMMPGAQPMEALALTLASRFPERSLKSIREDLEDGTGRGLHLLAGQLAKDPRQYVLLPIDQFEELFTLTLSEDMRRRFIDLLVTAATEPSGSTIIILTLRADFYDRPMAYPELCELIEAHHQLVLPMEMQELRAAIKQPAALADVQLSFEGDLAGDLLYEVQGQIGALPLLQFTLEQLFERRKDRLLTLEAYREIGGVTGALARHAEATYAALPSEEHRTLARFLFLRLIDPGITEQDTTRRRASMTEFSLPTPRETAMIQQVADAFVAARLLTANEVAETPTIEVSHEALIREWTRLSDWLREAREDIHLQHSLSKDVAEWERRGKPRDRLYRGSALKEARAWARRNRPSRQEAAFLQSSTTYRLRFQFGLFLVVLLLISMTGGVARLIFASSGLNLTTVTTLSDDGPGSLRQVIVTAKAGSTITFAAGLSGIIELLSDDLTIPKNLSIRGPGAHLLAISGGKYGHRVQVPRGVTVTLANLAFTSSTTGVNGGGIYNQGTLSLSNSTISGNTAPIDGGGIYNQGTLSLSNSTISGNTASTNGGGIYNPGGTLSLVNCTISGNLATGDKDGHGGGVAIFGGQAAITFCTVYGNASTRGGGIAIEDNVSGNQPGQAIIGSTIVAGNQAPTAPALLGTVTTSGYNLIQNASGATFNDSFKMHHTDRFVNNLTDVRIAPILQNNGGPTQTQALLPGSPAIDQIPAAACESNSVSTDQRGVKRPQGPACDIGAYEYVHPR